MSSRANRAKARKRVASVFTYLQELHRVRTPPIVDVDAYEWRLRLADVPAQDTIRWGARLASVAPAGARLDDEVVLRVARPTEEPCPEPPLLVRDRLRTGWDQPDRPARLQTDPPAVVDESDAFRMAAARLDAFEAWSAQRDAWARQQRPMALFLQLYELWTKFERESEKYQLYLGDGVLACDTEEGRVRHPVLLQRLDLRFDPGVPAFTLTESEDAPMLYAPMLRHLAVDGKSLLALQQRFADSGIDPLSGTEVDPFLQSLVHALWPDGEYVRSGAGSASTAGPRLFRDPMIYLGHRSQDFAGAIDRYLEGLDKQELPTALLRVVGIEPEAPAPASAAGDLLLTRPANPEQERVIRRLEETGAVLVQGPPGTGKSHTITNLIGHLLAQNKTILVTSHASKALRVLRDQVAPPLRSLCVSVLDSDDDSARQLEESITGILNYFSGTTRDALRDEIAELAEQRRALAARCAELGDALQRAVASEYGALELDGERVAIGEVARELVEARGQHDWLPGPVAAGVAEPPLSDDEVAELYAIAAGTDAGAERDRDVAVPDLHRLPEPAAFTELCNARSRADGPEVQGTRELWRHDRQTDAELGELADRVVAAGAVLADRSAWWLECLEAARRGRETAQPWRELVDLIRDCNARIPPRQALVLQHGPQIRLEVPLDEAIEISAGIVEHLSAGKKLGRMATMFKPPWQAFIRGCTVDGKPPETAEQFQAIRDALEIRALRETLVRRWDRQVAALGGPMAHALGAAPEQGALPYADAIERALRWEADQLRPCERALADAGLDWAVVVERTATPAGPHGAIIKLRGLLCETLPALIEARRRFVTWHRLTREREGWMAYLASFGDEVLARELADAIRHDARDAYARAHARAAQLAGVAPALARRDELLARVEPVARAWARAVRDREPPHDAGVPGAGDVHAAWSYRRWAQRLAEATATDLDAVQRELEQATRRLHELTARYVEKLAWDAQFGRTGLPQQQALAGWLALHKKIGKGSGRNAARLKEEAKRTLATCRQAVPVWIMPLSRVIESFDLATTKFDVVILDEASQCDILGLLCFAMAREVAVVGDHEQVSPYAVGHKVDKIQGLIDELLDDIPNKQLYDGKTSVYDLARQSFGGTIRLLEHFRCVPEIIEFSNRLCYAGDIRPLREGSSAQVRPPLIAHHVQGGQKIDKVNEQEAREIAALVTAACETPEYDGCTIGVISMVGTEQADVIDALLRRNLPASEYQRRRLLCGNASQFQGDERDVMFLSMVDSPSGGKPLSLRKRDDAKKVFNVAASRARDQLWVVHSLDPDRDLKDGDLRLALLQHAITPRVARDQPGAAPREPSAFEQALSDALRARGYRAVLHWPIARYSIDVAVEGRDGRRVALQCDGGRDQTAAEHAVAVERQLTLERLGWRFVRVRASAFAVDGDAAVERVCARLRELGVHAVGAGAALRPQHDDLVRRVLSRAAQLRGGSRATLRAVSSSDG